MNDAKVTIVTPTSHRLESLKEAIASIYSQSYQNWECFIVSDGYDTKVRQLVKTLRDIRVNYLFTLRTEYFGSLQRNLALKFASGKYVLCLDDDNIIYCDYIKKMVNGFVDEKIGYAICQIKYDGLGILSPQLPPRLANIDTLNYMVRTDLAREAGGWIPFDDYNSDFYLIDRISKISKGKFVPEVLGWHRSLPTAPSSYITSCSRKNQLARMIELLRLKNIIKKILARFQIQLYGNKSIKVNLNRIIYQVLCKTWLKF